MGLFHQDHSILVFRAHHKSKNVPGFSPKSGEADSELQGLCTSCRAGPCEVTPSPRPGGVKVIMRQESCPNLRRDGADSEAGTCNSQVWDLNEKSLAFSLLPHLLCRGFRAVSIHRALLSEY